MITVIATANNGYKYYDVENNGNLNEDDFHQFGVGEVKAASDAELVDRETKG